MCSISASVGYRGLTRMRRLMENAFSANGREHVLRDAEVAQPGRDADVRPQLLDGPDGRVGRLDPSSPVSVVPEQSATYPKASSRAGMLYRMTNGSSRPLPAPCEQWTAAADRVLHRVDQRHADVGERQPRQRRGQGHAVAGFEVVARPRRPGADTCRPARSPSRRTCRRSGVLPW